MDIELRYFEDCPNWRVTDELVRHRPVEKPEDAERLGFVGSPTAVIDGVDPFLVPVLRLG